MIVPANGPELSCGVTTFTNVHSELRSRIGGATRAAGPINTRYPRGDKPVMALIQELTARNDYGYIHLEKKGFSLTLHKEIRK